MRLRKRLPADLPQVHHLLSQAGLPADGLDQTSGWVVEMDEALVGHVALEATPDAVVIRSLVVDPSQQGHGLGERLMMAAEAAAEGRVLVLKTDTVGPWMLRRGYRTAPLGEVPSSVRSTTQFSGTLCAGTPIYMKESPMNNDTLKAAVRDRYTGFVTRNQSCCGPKSACGCSGGIEDPSLKIGYALQDVEAVPDGANLGLGCGNPVALASMKPGEVVLDLGSGAGFDAFLASKRVGPEGRVIGVDMTPAMLERARGLAAKHGYTNVEFREGDIESLPVEDATVDAVISNCVINLTTDKERAFREAFRVLKPGGGLMVSDLVLIRPLPEAIRNDLDAYAACVAGALLKDDYLAAIQAAGFQGMEVVGESTYDLGEPELAQVAQSLSEGSSVSSSDLWAASKCVVSVQIQATKPESTNPQAKPACCQSCCPND